MLTRFLTSLKGSIEQAVAHMPTHQEFVDQYCKASNVRALVILEPHPDIRIQQADDRSEQAPLLVIDNFVADPDRLVSKAAASTVQVPVAQYYPGDPGRGAALVSALLIETAQGFAVRIFSAAGRSLRLSMCHYSLVTTPPAEAPRFPAHSARRLAGVERPGHDSLSVQDGPGRHRLLPAPQDRLRIHRRIAPGHLFQIAGKENDGPDMPGAGVHQRRHAHCSSRSRNRTACSIACSSTAAIRCTRAASRKDFVPDPIPLTGRLSINSFIDAVA